MQSSLTLAGWVALGAGLCLAVAVGYCVRNPEALRRAAVIVETWADPWNVHAVSKEP